MITLKELLTKIRKWYFRRKAIRNLTKHNLYMLEMETILERWITKRILDGQTSRRDELLTKQGAIKEIEAIIEWLKFQ
jgi:hypothetical protein